MPISQVLLVLACVVASQATDPFVGKWKLDNSRSFVADAMSIAPAGPNTYTVKFVGAPPETIVADGQDHPGYAPTTLAITIQQPGVWKIVRKQDGRELLTAIWTLGADGQSLRDDFTSKRADGSSSTINLEYKRTAGHAGVPGTWESTSSALDPFELDFQSATDGFAITNSSSHATGHVHLDGKPHPNADSSAMVTARRVDERTYEVTNKVQGKVTYTQRVSVSPDGKTLTMSSQPVDQAKPQVLVFARE